MKLKDNSAAPALKEEAGHSTKTETKKEEPQEDDHANHTVKAIEAKRDKELLDNLASAKRKDVVEEINSCLTGEDFLALLTDETFQHTLKRVCERVIGRFKASHIYTVDDLMQDVLVRFARWQPRFRGDASLATALRKIAINLLIDVSRNRNERHPSFEDLEREIASAEKGHINADYETKILVEEGLSKLTESERALVETIYVDGRTPAEVAKALCVTRQAVSKRLSRVLLKLRSYMS